MSSSSSGNDSVETGLSCVLVFSLRRWLLCSRIATGALRQHRQGFLCRPPPAAYAARRGWTVALQVREVNSGAARREARERLLEAARRREIDVVLVWRLDRWGRSVTDLLATLQELEYLGVGFVSLTKALDLTTPAGCAMAGLLAIFAEFEREVLRERTRAGLAHARQNGKRLGRPATAAGRAAEVRRLHRGGLSKSEIARRLNIGRTSVRGILA